MKSVAEQNNIVREVGRVQSVAVPAFATICVGLLAFPGTAHAGALHIDAGYGFVQAHDDDPYNVAIGYTGHFSEKYSATLAVRAWPGPNEQYSKDVASGRMIMDGAYQGEWDIELRINYLVWQRNRFSAQLGAGLGSAEMLDVEPGDTPETLVSGHTTENVFDPIITFGGTIEWQLEDNVSVYGSIVANLVYGTGLQVGSAGNFFNIGVAYRVFD